MTILSYFVIIIIEFEGKKKSNPYVLIYQTHMELVTSFHFIFFYFISLISL